MLIYGYFFNHVRSDSLDANLRVTYIMYLLKIHGFILIYTFIDVRNYLENSRDYHYWC
jgi:hypothetical protein